MICTPITGHLVLGVHAVRVVKIRFTETVQSVAGSRAICRRKPCNLSPKVVQSVAGNRAICRKNGAILYYKVIYSNIYYSIEYLIKRPRLYNYFIFVFLRVLQAVIYGLSSHPHRSITEKAAYSEKNRRHIFECIKQLMRKSVFWAHFHQSI